MSRELTTSELLEIVRGFWASSVRRDWDAILPFYAPDAVWDMSPMGLGVYEDHASMRGVWQDWAGAYEELELDVEEALDLGHGVVLAVIHQRARPVGSTGQVESRQGIVYSWAGGAVERVTAYPDAGQARAAAEQLAGSIAERNVGIVRESFEAHRTGGIEAALRFYAPDFVWYPGPGWVEDEVYRGHDGARRLNAIFAANFEDYVLEVHEIRAVGDRVLALYEATGRIKGSGAAIRQPIGIVASGFRDATIGEVESFFGWERAREAVGLSGSHDVP